MCTNLFVKAKNGDVVVARSMDFASPTGMSNGRWEVGHKITDKFKVEIGFVGKYSKIGLDTPLVEGIEPGLKCVSDGMNDAGLSVSSLWLPSTRFAIQLLPGTDTVSGFVLLQAILGTCQNVGDVETFFKRYTPILPVKYVERFATVHFSVVDKTGAAKVIEIGTDGVPGSVHVYDNPVGVMTNAPEFPWQLRNLSCYTQIGLQNTPTKDFNGFTVAHTGFGANQLGLPGDAAPQSRFVRATTLLNAALAYEVPKDANAAMRLLDQVLRHMVVIKGVSADESLEGKKYDYTQWLCMKDLTKNVMYVRDTGDAIQNGYATPVYDVFS